MKKTDPGIRKNDLKKTERGLSIRETVIFAMLAAMMFASKILMQALPNIHLVGMFIVAITAVFRVKALIPLYVYVFLEGILQGFSVWWVPYLYIWTVLWAVVMLLPKNMKRRTQMIVYPTVCALHGFLFGTLFAPAWALINGLSFHGMLAWIVSGLSFDVIHGIGNLILGLLIVPLCDLMRRLMDHPSA